MNMFNSNYDQKNEIKEQEEKDIFLQKEKRIFFLITTKNKII